jgi:hypothetical protein
VNCTQGKLDHHDYECQPCTRERMRDYQRGWARKRRGGLREPRPPYMAAGEKHGRWLTLEAARISTDLVLCRCECGTEKKANAESIRKGTSKSCGCLRVELGRQRTTHGLSSHPLWGTWYNMVARCTRPDATGYADYGGRGITVCDRWLGPDGPANFIADMGSKPSTRHSLQRVDNDGPYSPGNCCWATPVEQGNNRRRQITNAEHAAALAEIERLRHLIGA